MSATPIVAVPRGPGYLLQPVTLGDTARVVADAAEASTDLEVDAAGPDRMHFGAYLGLVASAIGRAPRFVRVPPRVMIGALAIAGVGLRDIVLTREELAGLEQDLLVSHEPPLGTESVPGWIAAHGDLLGARYTNDTNHRFRSAVAR